MRRHRVPQLMGATRQAAHELTKALEELDSALDDYQASRDAGEPVSEALPHSAWQESRRRLIARLDAMSRALMALRAESIRIMVDDEGLSFAEAGRRLGHPRQLVTRLYQFAKRAFDE